MGHVFTQGTSDSNEIWLEVVAESGGRVIGRSGGQRQDGAVDPWSHFVNSFVIDRDGNRINRRNAQDIFTPLYSNQIPPGAADVVHFALRVPEDVTEPITVSARLRYRKFDTEYMQFVMEDTNWVNDLPVLELAQDRITFPVAGGQKVENPTPEPPTWQRWNDYGIGLLRKGGRGELRQAEAAFQEVEALGRPDGPVNLARVYLREGRVTDDAPAALRRARDFDPPAREWSVLWFSGLVNKQNGDFDAAIDSFRQIIEGGFEQARGRGFDFSRDYNLLVELGNTLYERAKQERGESRRASREAFLREAVEVLDQALVYEPENAAAHYNLKLIYTELGEEASSTEHADLHAKYKPDDNARDRAIAAARQRYPAANHAAEAVVIYDLDRPDAYPTDCRSNRKGVADHGRRRNHRLPGAPHAKEPSSGGPDPARMPCPTRSWFRKTMHGDRNQALRWSAGGHRPSSPRSSVLVDLLPDAAARNRRGGGPGEGRRRQVADLARHGGRAPARDPRSQEVTRGVRDRLRALRTAPRGAKFLPETMGGGAAFLDHDGDGDQDIFFVNGASWPHSDEGLTPGNRLYRNDGTGAFEDVTETAGIRNDSYGMGVAVGDYDGDGLVDVFTTGLGTNHLYRNLGGTFEDATETAGVGGTPDQWTSGAGFFDLDRDGDLDLFVCRYIQWSREIDELQAFTLNGVDRAYGPPMSYAGTFSCLYRNEGDGTFTDVSEEAGIQQVNPATGEAVGKALAVSFLDYDEDGWLDVAVANDTVQNHLFHNLGDGTFEEVGSLMGIGFDTNGKATGAMGIDVADFRNDGELGVCIGNFANEMSSLFVTRGPNRGFSDDAMAEGIGSPSRRRLSFGVMFLDYDLDGREDLLQVNGHLEQTINEVQPSQSYLQPTQLFWNAGPDARSCFQEVPPERTGDLGDELAGRGSAYADIDGDGDLDVLLCQVGAPPVLLRNDQTLGNRWLRVRLEDRGANRHGIGAWVTLKANGDTQRRLVSPTKSYLSQSELTLTFGLGRADRVESLEVIWPDGTRQPVAPPDGLDRELVVRRAP